MKKLKSAIIKSLLRKMILKQLSEKSKSEAKAFAIANKDAILKAKRAQLKTSAPLLMPVQRVKPNEADKAAQESETNYEIVGNAIGFMDSHFDVSMPGSFTKTVNENGANIPLLVDHNHSPEAIYAKNNGVYIKELQIRSCGYEKEGMTTALCAKIAPIYNDKMSLLYEAGEIRQHSVGIRYIKLDMATNDPEDTKGYEVWQKTIDSVINKEMAEEYGFYFPIYEQKLFEISAVLFGSNPYTPTLNNLTLSNEPRKHSKKHEPLPDLVKLFNSLN